jgi:serine/threonine protein kinase
MSDPSSERTETYTVLSDLPPENVGSVIGPYKLLQQLGQGGFGVVYMAEQEKPVRRMVALKIIKPGMDTGQVIARFESERQALAIMDHPNIARVLDAGATASGHPYFVMELVRGVPITEFCDKNHLPPEDRLKLFVDVCHAIQHAHHKGIIHRDIKPSNVLVTLHDGVPVVKVIDFGVAKATVQKLTERTLFTAFGQMIGTPEYMSPEQAEMSGLDIDTRSDVYSLGVLLYELLTGTTPLEAKRLREAGYAKMQKLIQEEEPPRPSTRLSSLGVTATLVAGNRGLDVKRLVLLLSGDLDWVVMKALEKERSRRYPTPDSFAEDIERYLHDEAITARPPSSAYRLKKLVQRNKTAVFTAALVALALLVGSGVATWQAVRATHAEREALVAAQAANAAAEREAKAKDDAVRAAAAEKNAKNDAVVAANAAKQARNEALVREAETKAVLGFVESRVFAAARPQGQEGGLGRDVTMRKAIGAALKYVNQGFSAQPLIEARLRLTLAKSFFYLGDAKTSTEQEEAALAIYTRLRGPDDPDTLLAMNALGSSYEMLGRLDDALKLREETYAKRKAILGPDHLDTLASLNNLGNSYGNAGRLTDAVKIREEYLARTKAVEGKEHPDVLMAMNNLANAYHALGRYDEALKLRREVLPLYQQKMGLEHPDTLRAMGNLANSLDTAGRYDEALKLREQSLALRRARLGPDHQSTLISMAALGSSYANLGRHQDALKLREEALALRRAKLGPDHPDTLQNMSDLVQSYTALGRHADALKLSQETCARRKAKLGSDHPDTLESLQAVGECYSNLHRFSDAAKVHKEVLALRKAKIGLDHLDTIRSMEWLALDDAHLDHRTEAVKLLREVYALRKAKLGDDNPETLYTVGVLAENLSEVGRGAEAMRILDETMRIAKSKKVDPSLLASMYSASLKYYLKAKDAPGRRRTLDEWEKLNLTDANNLYNSACFRALTAASIRATDKSASATREADANADRAMEFLKRAIRAGLSDKSQIETDSDLESLRNRDDFKKLLKELQPAASKGKP